MQYQIGEGIMLDGIEQRFSNAYRYRGQIW